MTRHIAVYAGTIALLFAAGTPGFSEPTGSPAMWCDSNASTQPFIPGKTEWTDGQAAVQSEYADTSVGQGKLEEVEDSRYLNATGYNTNGEEIGKIQQVLKDTKTGEVEYTVSSVKNLNCDIHKRETL